MSSYPNAHFSGENNIDNTVHFDQWYVSAGNRFGGPFTTRSIQVALSEGDLGRDTMVWAKRYDDWQTITAIPEFASLLTTATRAPNLAKFFSENEYQLQGVQFIEGTDLNFATSGQLPHLPAMRKGRDTNHLEMNNDLVNEIRGNSRHQHHSTAISDAEIRSASKAKGLSDIVLMRNSSRRARLAACLIAGGIVAGSITNLYINSQRIQLDKGVAFADVKMVNKIAQMDLEEHGALVHVVTSSSDLITPTFYLGTNLPDGEALDFELDAIADSLAGPPPATLKTTVTTKGHLAITPKFRDEAGVPFPRGKYRVSVQSEKYGTLIKDQEVFIGGVADEKYLQDLQSYKLKAKVLARQELLEVKQIADSLKNQLSETQSQFNALVYAGAGRNSSTNEASVNKWKDFSSGWVAFQNELEALTREWASTAGSPRRFYKGLANTIFEASRLIADIHQRQADFVTKKANAESKDIITQNTASAFKILSVLNDQSDQLLASTRQ